MTNEILIKRTFESGKAFEIAKSLTAYFNAEGLENIKKDTAKDILFGAYLKGEMAGFVVYRELNSEAIELIWIAVKKEYQKQGIGGKLVQVSLKQIDKKYKLCEVKALSETNRDKGYELTRSFYKQLGFIPLETINPYPGWKDPCQIFIKCLH